MKSPGPRWIVDSPSCVFFLNIVKPQLVVDYRKQEKKLKALTLRACGNNVKTFLITMETMKILINSMLTDKEEFYNQRFNTIIFDQLLKTSCKDFLTNFKQARSN